jgi:hypothetical protein
MEYKSIKFSSTKKWIDDSHITYPSPANKNLPTWYKESKNFMTDKNTGEILKDSNGNKIVSWRACPSMLDTYLTGYVLKTPCDITFYKNEFNIIDVNVENQKYKDFCQKRSPMDESGFFHPKGFYKNHFAWHGYWNIETPEGYSCLFLNPINHFNLPFLDTSGIIDTDKVSIPGSIPFFIPEGWTGTIQAGTPYMQVIPFKKENWESTFVKEEEDVFYKKKIEVTRLFRQRKTGGIYKEKFWNRKDYK